MASFVFPSPDRQAYVRTLLDTARRTILHDAVTKAAGQVQPETLASELRDCAPTHGLDMIKETNTPPELLFATPSTLRVNPHILGYYRLLLGISQKQFYKKSSGLAKFWPMEDRGVIRNGTDSDLPILCRELNEAVTVLVSSIPAGSLAADIEQLPLMTFGAQADGSWRNRIGEKATIEVYDAIKAVIKSTGRVYVDAGTSLTVANSSDREVTIALSPDPDVEIRERLGDTDYLRAAIEIKGGADYANIHNRAGEAEKSHQKAKGRGAGAFWTIIACAHADMKMLKSESPTTQHWFDIDQVRAASGRDWDRLVSNIRLAMGI